MLRNNLDPKFLEPGHLNKDIVTFSERMGVTLGLSHPCSTTNFKIIGDFSKALLSNLCWLQLGERMKCCM